MLFFQNLMCATIVFVAYYKLGYYSLFDILSAVKSYFKEKLRLRAEVLMVTQFGLPIGTLMCSKDDGWLPTDVAFAAEMQKLRLQYGSLIGYFGKFAVIPWLQGLSVGNQLLERAVTEWALKMGVEVAVMMVNPRHVRYYRGQGAEVLALSKKTKGMEKAPAVLMVINFRKSPKIQKLQAEYKEWQKRQSASDIGLEVVTS